jgi:hypothetical protein
MRKFAEKNYLPLWFIKKPPHKGGVSFRFTFRKNAICMRRHFYEPEREKKMFLPPLTINNLRAIKYFSK